MRTTHFKDVKVILLDIEGTLCPISFVKDVLFPYALNTLTTDLERLWTTPSFQPYITTFPEAQRSDPSTFLAHIRDLMATDAKIAPLKNLQGYLWQSGYESGALRCPLFSDVAHVLDKWNAMDLRILIYSSGSVAAQRLLFQYTDVGDLRPMLSGYFDIVSAGPKDESSSYARIVAESAVNVSNPHFWLFCSDRPSEIKAAEAAGLQGVVILRPENTPLTDTERVEYRAVESFVQLDVQQRRINGLANSTSISDMEI